MAAANRRHRERKRAGVGSEKPLLARVCVVCGEEFLSRGTTAKYCPATPCQATKLEQHRAAQREWEKKRGPRSYREPQFGRIPKAEPRVLRKTALNMHDLQGASTEKMIALVNRILAGEAGLTM
jgi:hypothetical protein